MKEAKISFALALGMIFMVVIPSGVAIYSQWNKMVKDFERANYSEEPVQGIKISRAEKLLIEAWIVANNLNEYGDPKDTVYTGGTPLFDEATGQRIDKYKYILKKHPDRPWRK